LFDFFFVRHHALTYFYIYAIIEIYERVKKSYFI